MTAKVVVLIAIISVALCQYYAFDDSDVDILAHFDQGEDSFNEEIVQQSANLAEENMARVLAFGFFSAPDFMSTPSIKVYGTFI